MLEHSAYELPVPAFYRNVLDLAPALPVAGPVVALAHLTLGHDRILMTLIPLHAQLIVDVPDPGDPIEDILGNPLGLSALDRSGEGHLAVLDLDLNPRGVEHAVMGQMLADVLFDPGVAALVALRSAAGVWSGHPASGS